MENLDVASLLEREEKKAKDRVQQLKRETGKDGDNGGKSNVNAGDDDIAMGEDFVNLDPEPYPRSADHRNDPIPRLVPSLKGKDTGRLDRPEDLIESISDRNGKNRYKDDRDEDDETRTRRSRGRGDDDAANGASDKDSANGSGRISRRGRSRSPDRPDSRGSGYRQRSPDRVNSGTDRYYGGGRRSSFDDDAHYRPHGGRRGSRDRGGRRDHGSSRYDDERSGRRDHHRRDPPQGNRKRKTPEPTDDERDRRTVFVQQLAARLRTKQLTQFFEQAGPVVEAQVVKDRVSGRSKGVGYVEFKSEESLEKAIALTGQKLLGIPIIVQLTEAEKNRIAKNEGGATQSNGVPFHRLYVGNIHFSITEDDLKNVFEPFGELEFVQLQKEDQGRSKGYGFVQFIDPAQAKEALEKMNGFELAGRPIRVGLGNDKFTPESTQSLLQRFGKPQAQGSSFSGMGGRGAHAGGTGNFDRPTGRDVDKTGGASALDDTDVGGVNFNNYSRDALMRKLARIDEPEQKTTTKTTQQRKPAVIEQTPTRCVIIKNAYDQNTETEPTWKEDLKNDVKGECDKKYGKVVHIDLALDSNDGEIYIKFENVAGGKAAIQGLNGRWFDNRQITAQYVVDAVYNMNFPKAQKV